MHPTSAKRAPSTSRSNNIWAGSDSDFVPSPVQLGNKTAERPAKRRKVTACGAKKKTISVEPKTGEKRAAPTIVSTTAVNLEVPQDTEALPPTSELGIPLTVNHARKSGTTDDVWDLIHTLEIPYKKQNPWKQSVGVYHNICLLCCQLTKSRAKTNRFSWEEALRNTRNASNAKDHIKSKHADHPLAILAEQSATDKSKADVTDAEAVLDLTQEPENADISPETTTTTGTTTTSVSAGAVSVGAASPRFFGASEKTINVLISKFLISQGLPCMVCASSPFKDIICAATGNASFRVLGRDRHDRLLNGQFQLFCELVGTLLSSEFEIAGRLKFLNLLHDIWTSCGKESIVGASIAFIDSAWRFRFIALLACVKSDGHNALSVAKVIESGIKSRYNLDIRAMTRFTMSDTTPSARNVADHINTEQESCSMHLLNLCTWLRNWIEG
ncbi:hypothetical protein DVH05_008925 [Phytophthora capsici]|nr:hypothetical protein DVH05_007726 [Phytophthora capsici]KAG1711679.1 hypothetical protein DVH05_008925 [Phytophthora capsici]